MAKQQSSMGFLLLLMVAMLILFDPSTRKGLANIVDYIFFPIFGFNYRYPVLTIFLAGSIIIIISALIRHFATNWVEMAKMQDMVSFFQREYRNALKSQNKHKLKKLQKLQEKIMKKQGEVSSQQMKLMPITLIIFVPIFTWMWEFLLKMAERGYHYYIDVPWKLHVSLFASHILPNWILLYTLLSIPLTQVIQYILRLKWLMQ